MRWPNHHCAAAAAATLKAWPWRAMWNDLVPLAVSAALFLTVPVRDALGQTAFLLPLFETIFLVYPPTLSALPRATAIVTSALLLAAALGYLGSLIARGDSLILSIVIFFYSFFLSILVSLSPDWKVFAHFGTIFSFLILADSRAIGVTPELTATALSVAKTGLAAGAINLVCRATVGLPVLNHPQFTVSLRKTLQKCREQIVHCSTSVTLSPDQQPTFDNLHDDIARLQDSLFADIYGLRKLGVQVRLEKRYTFSGQGQLFCATSDALSRFISCIADFSTLCITRLEDPHSPAWEDNTKTADLGLREGIKKPLQEALLVVDTLLQSCCDELDRSGQDLISNDKISDHSFGFVEKLRVQLKQHVPSALVPAWPFHPPAAAVVIDLAHFVPLVLEEGRCLQVAVRDMACSKNTFDLVFDDWSSGREWLHRQIPALDAVDISKFVHYSSSAGSRLIFKLIKLPGLGNAITTALRTALLVVGVGVVGFIEETRGVFSTINGLSAVATVIVIASEVHYGFLLRKGMYRASGIILATVWSWAAWELGQGDKYPAVTWIFHLVAYMVATYVVRVLNIPYFGVMICLMFTLTLDTFIQSLQQDPACTAGGCNSQFTTSSFRLAGVLGAVLVTYVGSLVFYPRFARTDVRKQLHLVARDVYFMYGIRIRGIRKAQVVLSRMLDELKGFEAESAFLYEAESSLDLGCCLLRNSELDGLKADLVSFERDAQSRFHLISQLIGDARNEPRWIGSFDEKLYRGMAHSLLRMSRRISLMYSYERMQQHSYNGFTNREYQEDLRLAKKISDEEKLVRRTIMSLHTISTSLRGGSFIPQAFHSELSSQVDRGMGELESLFNVKIVVDGCVSDGDGAQGMDLTRPLPMLMYLRLTSVLRMQVLMKDVCEEAMQAFGYTDMMSVGEGKEDTAA